MPKAYIAVLKKRCNIWNVNKEYDQS